MNIVSILKNLPLEQYGFEAPHDRYLSASALEEITDYLSDAAKETTYKGAIQQLKALAEIVQWHIDHTDDDAPASICHKDDPRFHMNRGS